MHDQSAIVAVFLISMRSDCPTCIMSLPYLRCAPMRHSLGAWLWLERERAEESRQSRASLHHVVEGVGRRDG